MTLAANDPRHGTLNGYSNLKCRCTHCRRVWADYCTELNRRKGVRPREVVFAERRVVAEARQDNHGTESRYNFGCRCADCRNAMAAARRDRRSRPNVQVHGKPGGYSNGCRCVECRRAHRVYQNDLRARRRAAA